MNLCHDCNVKEGQVHQECCDMEICPKCKGQFLSCDCPIQKISLDGKFVLIGKKNFKREPYFQIPIFCAKCGKKYPEWVMLSDKEWKEICGISFEKEVVLCRKCINQIKKARGLK